MNLHAATFLRVLSQLARDLGIDIPAKVLIVERDDNSFKMAKDLLSSSGIQLDIRRAKSVEAARNFLQREYVDLCVTFSRNAKGCLQLGVPVVVVTFKGDSPTVPLGCQLTPPPAGSRYVESTVRNAVAQSCSSV